MGNRAYITFEESKVSLYVHWNGGPESVVSFVDYMNEAGVRTGDPSYGCARLAQIVGNYFGGILSVGIEARTGGWQSLAGEDNGAYLVATRDDKWQIVKWSRVPDDALPDVIRRARKHAYNANGELLAELRAKNDPFFKRDEAKAA